MKKLLLILTFVLSIFTLGDSNKLTKPSKFLLKEIIPELTEVRPSDEYPNHFWEVAHKTQLEVYKNNKWDNKKIKNYNEKGSKIKITYYYSKDKLGKIVKEVIDGEKQVLEIYYLKNKEPFYVILKIIFYDEIESQNLEEIEKNQHEPIYTDNCYFVDNKLFHIFSYGDCGAPWHETYLKEQERNIRKKLNSLISKQ